MSSMSHHGKSLPSNEVMRKAVVKEKAVSSVGVPTSAQSTADDSSDEDCYGPALPPGISAGSNPADNVIGPLLPPHLMKRAEESASDDGDPAETAGGDSDNKDEDSGADEDIFGPLPPSATGGDAQDVDHSVEQRFEARAEQMRKKLEPQEEEPHREEWMTALPSNKKKIGLGLTNRTFKGSSSYVVNEDRSVWTDTPVDRQRKKEEAKDKKKKKKKTGESVPLSVQLRNEDLRVQTEEYNKMHRAESLMTQHQKKRKADLESGNAEKRPALEPFDPERDMKPEIMLDAAARRKVIASSKNLDSRFQRSTTENQFL